MAKRTLRRPFGGVPLFDSAPKQAWSLWKKTGFWAWNVLWMLAASAGLTLCSLRLAVGHYDTVIIRGYFEHPLILLLNFLPVLLLTLLLWLLTPRPWLGYLLSAGITVGGSAAHYFKLLFRDDPVMFADLLILREAGTISAGYDLALDEATGTCLAAVLAGLVFVVLFVRGRPRLPVRGGGIAAVLLSAWLLAPTYLSDAVYAKTAHYEYLPSQWVATQQFIARGFVYPFFHSAAEAFPTPPEGYDEKEAAALLAQYEDADIPEERKVNVIGIMLEAFADFSDYESIVFNADPYAQFRALQAESYHGTLTTNIFAGGTIDTERAFLTGCYEPENYRAKTSSYVWYLKGQGYQTTGDHPCYQWFYNRRNINQHLGFDEYRFSENFYADITGGIAGDRVLLPELLTHSLELMESDAPLFSFSVSYQGHGPYSTTGTQYSKIGDYVSAEAGYTQESLYILENYFGSVANTMHYVTEFVDGLRRCEEPVVLVLFGDHKPWLGDGNSVYKELGIDFNMGVEAGVRNYYDTPYLIWANDAAKAALGSDFVGEGPNVAPCFLMNVLFEQCGWAGDAFLQAAEEIRQELPVIMTTDRYVTAAGLMTNASGLTEEQRALVRQYEMLEYYRKRHFAE